MPMLRWSAVALSGLLALAIAGTPAIAQKPGGTLVQITQPEPPNLAPYISTSAPISQVTAKVYDGLLEYGFDLKPKAAPRRESWEVAPDGKTVTFKLRKDVKFHDGKPFTSADVQFTIMEVLKKVHPRGINTFRDVTAVETPDDYTAVFKLANAAPYMLAALSGYESPMLPKHVFGQGDISTHANANQPDRHRALQVRRVAARRAGAPRQEPGLLAQGPALSRPHRGALHQRRGDAHGRPREGRGACGGLRRRALQRRQEAGARCPPSR